MSNPFDDYLLANNISILTDQSEYIHPQYINEERLFHAISTIKSNNLKVMLFNDCDPDGLICGLQWVEVFRHLNHRNYKVWGYKNKEHSIDIDCVDECIENGYDYLVISDVGSNEMTKISKLCKFGVKVIIVDHHVSNYRYDDYPSECIIVNTVMNNRKDDRYLYTSSAGSLTFSLLYKYCCLTFKKLDYLSCFGLITLYSDSVDMSDSLNRSIYRLAVKTTMTSLPRFVRDFIGNTSFNRRFIEFSLVPKINSLFRSEKFDIINNYFFNDGVTTFKYQELLESIKNVYDSNRELTDRVTDLVDREVLNNFVIANLSSCGLPDIVSKLYNYTGIIANNLAQEYGKPCIVLCDTGVNIKGSFRDLLGRDYLQIFNQFCVCGGHPPAFGIHINYIDVENFLDMIRYTIDKKFFVYKLEDNLIVDINDVTPNVNFLNRMALYNEFSGGKLPIAMIRKRNLLKELSSYRTGYYRYKWGECVIESRYKVVTGAYMKIKPLYSKNLRLVTYNRG